MEDNKMNLLYVFIGVFFLVSVLIYVFIGNTNAVLSMCPDGYSVIKDTMDLKAGTVHVLECENVSDDYSGVIIFSHKGFLTDVDGVHVVGDKYVSLEDCDGYSCFVKVV